MDLGDWLLLLTVVMWIFASLIVAGVVAAVMGRLNAHDDDDPPTILIRPAMSPDDGDWK